MPSVDRALALALSVKPYVGGLKIGLEFINACGPEGIRTIVETGLPVFADVKLHDIPNPVAGAVRARSRRSSLHFSMFTPPVGRR
jgi:orotidine-5'-phosphate decarboxylase